MVACLDATLAECRQELGWPAGRVVGLDQLFARLLRRLRAAHPPVDPWLYDLPPALVTHLFPDLDPPTDPPRPLGIEEPPFVAIPPWITPDERLVAGLPLVVKSPANAYRLPFLAAAFRRARVRIVHLTRNPASAFAGLIDGWRYRGFWSHEVGDLAIDGYSDRFPGHGHAMWKFDLPPGWQAWRHRPLAAVVAFQWCAAHEALLDARSGGGYDALVLGFEELIGPADVRARALDRLGHGLRLAGGALSPASFEALGPIMATHPPRQRRWFSRAGEIEDQLVDPRVVEITRRLGYGQDRSAWL